MERREIISLIDEVKKELEDLKFAIENTLSLQLSEQEKEKLLKPLEMELYDYERDLADLDECRDEQLQQDTYNGGQIQEP